jgi:hypothetical protein
MPRFAFLVSPQHDRVCGRNCDFTDHGTAVIRFRIQHPTDASNTASVDLYALRLPCGVDQYNTVFEVATKNTGVRANDTQIAENHFAALMPRGTDNVSATSQSNSMINWRGSSSST